MPAREGSRIAAGCTCATSTPWHSPALIRIGEQHTAPPNGQVKGEFERKVVNELQR
jgi:hypothetical protein